MSVCGTCLGSGGADVLHALDAADAAVGDFGTCQADVVPVTPLSIEPVARAWRENVKWAQYFKCEANRHITAILFQFIYN